MASEDKAIWIRDMLKSLVPEPGKTLEGDPRTLIQPEPYFAIPKKALER
jgi:hypothetical protein